MKNNISEFNYHNQQYADNTRGYNSSYNSENRVPRGWLIFAQILGTIISVIGLLMFIYFMQDIYRSLPTADLTKKSLIALLLAIIVYFVWRSIYTAIIIVRLATKSSDAELCANRYLISALSLGVGGLFTPFLMTSFPNVATTSTIKPRYFLSKTMGLCVLIGAPLFAIVYYLPLLVGTNAVANSKLIFDTTSKMGVISILVLTISVTMFVFGLLTTISFSAKQAVNAFTNNRPSPLLKIIAMIWMTILTFELVLVILFSIVRLIGAVVDLFRRSEEGGGALMMIFALLNLFITISYVGMVIYVTTRTIAGLWAIDGNIKIGKYQHNKFAQSRLYRGNMSSY